MNPSINSDSEAHFIEALRLFSKALSDHGASELDRLMLIALSHREVQKKFINHLTDQQFFLNAQNMRIGILPGYSQIIFNFAYLPPKISLLSISLSVVLENESGNIKNITDPYYPKIGTDSSKSPIYAIGPINKNR